MNRLDRLRAHLTSAASATEDSVLERSKTSGDQQQQTFGKIGSSSPNDIVIVNALRTPITKANRGQFKNTTPDDLLKAVLEAVLKQSGIKPSDVDDIVVGNAQLQGLFVCIFVFQEKILLMMSYKFRFLLYACS
jgi:hypothetical protein